MPRRVGRGFNVRRGTAERTWNVEFDGRRMFREIAWRRVN
jgi:hypothetical protein